MVRIIKPPKLWENFRSFTLFPSLSLFLLSHTHTHEFRQLTNAWEEFVLFGCVSLREREGRALTNYRRSRKKKQVESFKKNASCSPKDFKSIFSVGVVVVVLVAAVFVFVQIPLRLPGSSSLIIVHSFWSDSPSLLTELPFLMSVDLVTNTCTMWNTGPSPTKNSSKTCWASLFGYLSFSLSRNLLFIHFLTIYFWGVHLLRALACCYSRLSIFNFNY